MPELANATIKEQRDEAFRFRGQSITYTQKNDSLNVTTGTVTEDDTPTTIGSGTDDDPGVLVSMVSDQLVANSGGKYHAGDVIFRIRNDDMPETPPKTTSKITFNSKEYNIVSHRQSADTNVWSVIGRLP